VVSTVKFLVLVTIREGVDAASELAPHAREETRRVLALYAAGVVREMYSRIDRPGAVLVAECADEGEGEALGRGLPFVSAGLADAEVVELAPLAPLAGLFGED